MNLTHIDLFCGAGGFGLGFDYSGFDTVFANDMNKDACLTYENNLNIKPVQGKLENIEIDYLKYYRSDVLTAGFPCQPFSIAGKMRGFNDDRASFYNSLMEFINITYPKFVVFENVKNFVNHNNGKSIYKLTANLENLGYDVKYKILNSWDYDTPQKRERVLIIANSLCIDYEFPEPTGNKFVLKDFISNLPESDGFKFSEEKEKYFKLIPEGGDWRNLPTEELKKEAMGKAYNSSGGRTGYLRRLDMNKPSPTLLTTVQSKMTAKAHPIENRWLNIKEYAAIQTFPNSYSFSGSLSSQYKQIGNAIPVNLAYHIAESIKKYLI